MIPARDALARLKEGNRRFVEHLRDPALDLGGSRRFDPAMNQQPFAIVLGCSDSRVPAELVFGQGFGDLFVIRVAGNIVAPSQVGSVEFAATAFHTRLVVVMGHTGCGAIAATLEELRRPAPSQSPGLRSIVDRVRPAVEALMTSSPDMSPGDLAERAVRANISASADHLRHGSEVLQRLSADGLLIVGAEYSLETGVVDFFDGVPPH
ncbi:MAG: carbonic anhydrase [Gemmatimonadales bacterium]